jgi:hypothetical protein
MLNRPPLKPRPTASPVRTSGAAECIVAESARYDRSASNVKANVIVWPLTSRKEIPVAPWNRLSYATSGSARLSFPWMTLEMMIRTDPRSSASTIAMIGTIEIA